MSDYTWPNKINGSPIRAGIRFGLYPEQKSNYDFVEILINDGKVWAVWRDDATSTYSHEKTIADKSVKYPGAAPINSYFDILENDQRKSDGTQAVSGFELYQDKCSSNSPPFGRVNQGDKMGLQNGCNKFFRPHYGVISNSGVKTRATDRPSSWTLMPAAPSSTRCLRRRSVMPPRKRTKRPQLGSDQRNTERRKRRAMSDLHQLSS